MSGGPGIMRTPWEWEKEPVSENLKSHPRVNIHLSDMSNGGPSSYFTERRVPTTVALALYEIVDAWPDIPAIVDDCEEAIKYNEKGLKIACEERARLKLDVEKLTKALTASTTSIKDGREEIDDLRMSLQEQQAQRNRARLDFVNMRNAKNVYFYSTVAIALVFVAWIAVSLVVGVPAL